VRHPYLLLCLVLSGFAGLAYELLWVRLLALSFGTTTLSFSTVLAVFFGGLALGAFVAGRFLHRVRRPVRAYALVELGTGIAGLVLHPVLERLGELFAAVDPGPGLAGALTRLAVATPLLLVPTVLMGATLPLVTRAMIRDDAQIARGTALIYGFNTVGACLGTYLITFHLLYALGIWGSTRLTIVVNLIVFAVAYVLGGRDEAGPTHDAADPTQVPSPADPKLRVVSSALTFVGGFAAIALQVVWVRQFSVFLEGTVYGTGSVLIAVLVGIALGSLGVSRALAKSANAALWFSALQLVAILAVLALVSAFPWLQYSLSSLGQHRGLGAWPLHQQLFLVVLALLLPTICSGASLPLLIRIVERRAENAGQTLGLLYAANTVGSILGSLATGFYLLPTTGSEATTWIALVALALVGALGALFLDGGRSLLMRTPAMLAPLAAVGLYQGFDVTALAVAPKAQAAYRPHLEQTRKEQRSVDFFVEGEAATVALKKAGDSFGLTLNGLGQGGLDRHPPRHMLESLLVGFVPLAHRPQAERALVVGLGAGATVDVLNRLGVDQITVVELEPRVADAVARIYGDENPLQRPGVELVIDDARHHLAVQSMKGAPPYDLLTSMPAHPWVASPIFTREFFEIARDRLTEAGVFSTWFGTGKMDAAAVKSVVAAFAAVFPHANFYFMREVGAYYLVGSKAPLVLDPARIDALLAHPLFAGHASLERTTLPAQLYASRLPDDPVPSGGLNADDFPFVELHAPRSSTTSPMLSGFLSREAPHPGLFGGRAEFIVETLEAQLATPLSRPLPRRLLAVTPRARAAVKALAPALDSSVAAYFEARLGSNPEPLRSLARSLGARAQVLAALTFPPGSSPRIEALRAIEGPEAAVALLEESTSLALERAPSTPTGEPFSWLLWAAAHPEHEWTDDEARFFDERVGPALARSERVEALRLCELVARARGLVDRAALCAAWRLGAEAKLARQLTGEGRAAGSKGDFRTAVEKLVEAEALQPGQAPAQELLLRALVETRDDAGLAALRRRMQFVGVPSARFESLRADAVAGRESASLAEDPEADDGADEPADAAQLGPGDLRP
jgi:spermidine synthase